MPLVGLVCRCGKCKGDNVVPTETALEHAATRHGADFPYELLASMVAHVQDRGTRISTTTLTTECLRSTVLERLTDYVDDPKKMYASFRGTMFHGQLEQYAHHNAVEEVRYFAELEGLGPISGSPDLVDVSLGYLFDYKFSKENPRFGKPWKDHVAQLQVNRWLVDHAIRVEHRGVKYDLNDSLNRATFVPVDWQGLIVVYMDDKGPQPLLIQRSEQVPKKDGKGTKSARVADIWSDDQVEEWLRPRYEKAQDALEGGELPDIPEGYEYWQHPLCNFCAVKPECVRRFIDSAVQVQLTTRRAS